MCLVLFAYKAHPEYKLIVAANRDEAYARETAPAYFWDDATEVLAGRDLEKMGTWMGVTTSGRFAALTNYRDPSETTVGKRTRGELVADFLKGTINTQSYLQELANRRQEYPGYNFLAGDLDELYYFSNRGGPLQKVEAGVHGVSNHLLNTDWPKVKWGKAGLASIISEGHPDLVDRLFAHLENADPAPDHLLPSTGVSLEWERLLSPIFIKSEGYGTRSSTVILMNEKEIQFYERVHTKDQRSDQEFLIRL
ncbi:MULTISPECIES: NRDE family protein [unclassified Bacillus (in: firmicutes)]|uniref:NRDE family protein n=1 Tax=unclassified Bacillus (in: firmicutes) TaxID=185979 RepID=UPI001BEAA094|nr:MULTISPECIES: NRDE family protein [unclassified Bacillus (in: firmicutes)]MBT2640268.1 NRDE family protein [Bacillus sp. ISL-39]MBT2662676.1 NRDE family protein [Bacillus sp. ISL-45]